MAKSTLSIGCSPNNLIALAELGQAEVLGPSFIGLTVEGAIEEAAKIEAVLLIQQENATWLSKVFSRLSEKEAVAPARPGSRRERG
ncbi:MAG: hypothetical protein AAB860_00155 [Patescibacteria group bacterium]